VRYGISTESVVFCWGCWNGVGYVRYTREGLKMKNKLCEYTGMERLPSGNGHTLTSCCHEDSDTHCHVICEIENQKRCMDYKQEMQPP
jgi:hypothetical protein